MFGFLENGGQTQGHFRLSQKAFADLIAKAEVSKTAYNTAAPTPSGMSLEVIDERQALRLVGD